MYTFSEKRPRAVASAREISYDRGKGGDGVIEILEQTPGLVVCIKPVGVHAQGEAEADLPALLKRQLGCEIYPVHRLDQAVGGVMVFAKTAPAAAKLSQAIAGGALQKEYLAVLERSPERAEGELSDLLFHDRFKNKTYVVSKERKGVKKASLSYRVVAEADGCAWSMVRAAYRKDASDPRPVRLARHAACGRRKIRKPEKCSFTRSVVLRADAFRWAARLHASARCRKQPVSGRRLSQALRMLT